MTSFWKMTTLTLGLYLAAGAAPALATTADQEQVDALMKQVMKAYETPKAFSNTASMTISFSGEKMEEQFSSIYGADGSMEMRLPNLVVTVLDGYLYAEITGEDSAYLKRPIGKGFESTITSIFGGSEIIPYDYQLRNGKDSGWIQSMTFGLMQDPKVTAVSDGKDPAGADAKILEVSGPNGEMKIYIDAATHFITAGEAQVSDGSGPENMSARISMKMLAKSYDALPKPITFDPKGRKAVDTIEALFPAEPEPQAAGELAPDFTLPQYAGEEVTLSKLRGKIVVLDFWATWCGPCRKGLPLLQQFADWAGENTDDVVVYAVNVWERGKNAEEINQMVGNFWAKNKYTIPTLISMNDAVTRAYGISGIPVTVVIGKDGKIAKTHRGFSPNMLDQLKADVEKIRDAS
ncbi:MAG: TlpA disulfide reductase family protein [Phycisphaerales bacterium]|nr:TlpA disulfide reductase family protein [Phycisphaerales bacterium]